MNKRQRGRGRKPNNNNSNSNPNRSLDSNGPDVKIRGSASTIFDKYTTLARDATSSGHRVKAENYLQHAEHYLRMMMEQQAKANAHAEKQAAQQQTRQPNTENTSAEQKDDEGQRRNNDRSNRNPARRRQPDQNEAKDQNTNEETAEVSKEHGETVESKAPEASAPAPTPEADAKPKRTRRKKPVEAVAEAPPEEGVITAAE